MKLNQRRLDTDLTPLMTEIANLDRKMDLILENQQNQTQRIISAQNEKITSQMNYISGQVGNLQDSIYTEVGKRMRKLYINIFRITTAVIISLITITALAKGC